MSDNPPNAQKDGEGRRWYVHPLTGEQYVSVTTALDILNKPALVPWAAGLAAEAAADNLGKLLTATLMKDCGNTRNRCSHDWRDRCERCPCGECTSCVVLWLSRRHNAESTRRADEGTEVHDVIEFWALNNGIIRGHSEGVAPFIRQFQEWVTDYGLTPDAWDMAEATVINREYWYAGTLDDVIRFRATDSTLSKALCEQIGKPEIHLLGDVKTRGKDEEGTVKLYPENALQLSAYRNAEVIMLRDGTEHPLPKVDGAFILQLRPNGYTMRLIHTDDRSFGAFLSVLSTARWLWNDATAAVSPLTHPVHRRAVMAHAKAKAVADAEPEARTPPSGATKRATKTPAKRAAKAAAPPTPPPELLPDLAQTAKRQSATLRSLTAYNPTHGQPTDDIPF